MYMDTHTHAHTHTHTHLMRMRTDKISSGLTGGRDPKRGQDTRCHGLSSQDTCAWDISLRGG